MIYRRRPSGIHARPTHVYTKTPQLSTGHFYTDDTILYIYIYTNTSLLKYNFYDKQVFYLHRETFPSNTAQSYSTKHLKIKGLMIEGVPQGSRSGPLMFHGLRFRLTLCLSHGSLMVGLIFLWTTTSCRSSSDGC